MPHAQRPKPPIERALSTSVFVVHHLHLLPHGEEDIKLIGVYTSSAAAVAAAERLAQQPGFRDFPAIVDPDTNASDAQGFHVNEYHLDLDHWSEGYVTV